MLGKPDLRATIVRSDDTLPLPGARFDVPFKDVSSPVLTLDATDSPRFRPVLSVDHKEGNDLTFR